ncbi:MAG: hypothetical protein GC168_01260 [Candidatus Hydrogenedens sp.]|nr:hypothetical protein [Candidatus Hydrogenedens sp.]
MRFCAVAAAIAAFSFVASADKIPYEAGTFGQEVSEQWKTALDGTALTDIDRISEDDGTISVSGPGGSYYLHDNAFEATTPVKPGRTHAPKLSDIEDGLGRVWKASEAQASVEDASGRLWIGWQAGVARQTDAGWEFIEGKNGLPYTSFTCATAPADGSVWFGTTMGLVYYKDGEWNYRQGLRWLPGDEVRAIHAASNGDVWVATNGGVGRISFVPMTLREKAEYYEKEMDLIRRTEFGYVAEATLEVPGDRTSTIHHHDSDNDGLWTSMYGAGECFAYGATKDPMYKKRAVAAFEALRQLQKVTQGGEHAPPHGYVARTILPIDGPDPNEGRLERDKESQKSDALWKVYEPRWPKSADGKWYWKSDTSSDELDGHYFFYPAYYDLVCETEEEKERVREVVRDLTNHLIENGFYLVDHDGTPTRWSIYGPDSLNHDVNWWSERGLKSLSMLSYLTVAEHMTGDKKYSDAIQMLREKHAYDTNAMITKVQFGVGSGNQSDDEMAIMCYYNLVKYTKDPDLREMMLYSFFQYYAIIQPELNPFFNFAYAAMGIDEAYDCIWGSFPIPPRRGWLADSMDTLLGFPLDRLDWPMKNSQRLDVVPLRWQQTGKDLFDPLTGRGYCVNGKVLPIENRHMNHWNHDPWDLDYGGSGRTLGNGTVFLLPYYMGLYHGFITE